MLHENSDLLIKFRKQDEKNALLTEQNGRQVLFCTVTLWLLHDDAKIHATSARLYQFLIIAYLFTLLYNVLENWREMNKIQKLDPLRAMKTFIRRKVGHTT